MKNFVVTISREFGCNARDISRELAGKLGVPFYDKDLIDMAAQRAGVNREVIRDMEDYVGKEKVGIFSGFTYGSSSSFYAEKAIDAQAQVIREVADKESCVLFGRCSDYFLKEYTNCLNVFLYSPIEERIKHISKIYGVTPKEAEKCIKRIDRQRHNYYKYVTGKNRGDRHGKHILIDTSIYGMEGSAKLLYDACRLRFGIE